MAKENGVIETVSGLKPMTDIVYFDPTVEEIRAIFQSRLDTMIAAHNRQCNTSKEYAERNRPIPDIQIVMNGLMCGDKDSNFTVLNLVLPISVAVGGRRSAERKDECSLFDPEENDDGRQIEIIPQIWEFFRKYTFSKDDAASFTNPSIQKSYGIYRGKGGFLRSLSKPRIGRYNGSPVVAINLNTSSVIKDYLKFTSKCDDQRPYDVHIESTHKIEGFNYKFIVRREVIKRNKRRHNDESDYINSLMNSKRRK